MHSVYEKPFASAKDKLLNCNLILSLYLRIEINIYELLNSKRYWNWIKCCLNLIDDLQICQPEILKLKVAMFET